MQLSICIPTYNRPELLKRVLASLGDASAFIGQNVELVISDNSTDKQSEQIVHDFEKIWPGSITYRHNVPGIPRIDNQNQAISLATGKWIQVLHDDDYLLPGGLTKILDELNQTKPTDRVLLFGVKVVDQNDQPLRSHTFLRKKYLQPAVALRQILSNSSMVRMPAIVIHRDAYNRVGLWESGLEGKEDIAMYIKLFSVYGVHQIPSLTCAYFVHPEAESYDYFNEESITILSEIFERLVPQGILSNKVIKSSQSHFLHQFILAGAYRRLLLGDRPGARKIMGLFQMPELQKLGVSYRWALVRLAFNTACLGAKENHITQA